MKIESTKNTKYTETELHSFVEPPQPEPEKKSSDTDSKPDCEDTSQKNPLKLDEENCKLPKGLYQFGSRVMLFGGAGGYAGGCAGMLFFDVGAIPGAIAGAAVGGVVGIANGIFTSATRKTAIDRPVERITGALEKLKDLSDNDLTDIIISLKPKYKKLSHNSSTSSKKLFADLEAEANPDIRKNLIGKYLTEKDSYSGYLKNYGKTLYNLLLDELNEDSELQPIFKTNSP